MIAGAVYGVALNDRRQLEQRAETFARPPYKAPPIAPVLYIKPRACFSVGGAPIPLPANLDELEVAATLGLLFRRDLTQAAPDQVRGAIGAACLALDVCEPHDSYYRPAIRQRCRDGFLPLGGFAALPAAFGDIVTRIDGQEAHRWSLDRLARPLEALCADVSGFMTLRAGDLLLIGLPGDAPRARAGQAMDVRTDHLPALTTTVARETAS